MSINQAYPELTERMKKAALIYQTIINLDRSPARPVTSPVQT